VIVRAVTYWPHTIPGSVPTLVPNVFLREPTPAKEDYLGLIAPRNE
jgi:hypothetical protein